MAHHGAPLAKNDGADELHMTPQDEMMQAIAMMLTAYHFDPRWAQHTASTHDIVSGDSFSKGDPVMPEPLAATTPAPTPNTHSAAPAESVAVHTRSTTSTVTNIAVLPYDEAEIFDDIGDDYHPSSSMHSHAHSPGPAADTAATAEPPSVEVNSMLKKARTKWSEDELQRFAEGLEIHGERKPKLIAKYMGTRNAEQVREHIKTLKRRMKEQDKSTMM